LIKISNQLEFKDISVIGHADFTILGRPSIPFCTVVCSVIEQTLSEKILVFKKKRRKGYKKSQGHKQTLTVVQVEKIEYSIPQKIIEQAVSLI
jgi:large subunit ribosomal protein L21